MRSCRCFRPRRRVIPRSNRKARIWLITAVHRDTNRSRTRCSAWQTELILGFDRHESHGGPLHGCGNRFGPL